MWRVEKDKEKSFERVAWAEQDFPAGSGTTFFFILAPDHTLHPVQEVCSWNLLMPRGSMLGNCKARTWGLTYRALASRVSPQPRHIALRWRPADNLTALFGWDCLCLPTVGRTSEVKIASGSQHVRPAGPPVRHVDVMQPWHQANLEHAFSRVGSVQVDTMQSGNQSNHRRGKAASTQQARLAVSWDPRRAAGRARR
jgi:hypothetical protein